MEHARLSKATWPTFICKLGLFSSLVLSVPTLAGCGPDVGATGPSQANPLDKGEQAVMDALNAHRAANGVPALAICASLNVSASAHSDDMRDSGYQDDLGKDGSTTITRACKAGYAPACSNGVMAEVIASGSDDAGHTVDQWKGDAVAAPILVNAGLAVLGVGRSIREDESSIWTVDFGGQTDPSCGL